MTDSVEPLLRAAYEAYDSGDIDGYLEACTDDFTFNVPGRSRVAEAWKGRAGVQEITRRVLEITNGSFREDVEAVFANDRHGAVLAKHSFTREGAVRSYHTAHVYRIENGKLAECWEQPRELVEFDRAWG
jgi:ketosteroid isomerase-like protein